MTPCQPDDVPHFVLPAFQVARRSRYSCLAVGQKVRKTHIRAMIAGHIRATSERFRQTAIRVASVGAGSSLAEPQAAKALGTARNPRSSQCGIVSLDNSNVRSAATLPAATTWGSCCPAHHRKKMQAAAARRTLDSRWATSLQGPSKDQLRAMLSQALANTARQANEPAPASRAAAAPRSRSIPNCRGHRPCPERCAGDLGRATRTIPNSLGDGGA